MDIKRLSGIIAVILAETLVFSVQAGEPEVIDSVPPGYEVVILSDTPGYYQRPGLADTGEVVWSRSDGPGMGHVYRYKRFEGIEELSDGTYNDHWPDISPDGSKVVWKRGTSNSPPFSLVLYENGVATDVEDAPSVFTIPAVNDDGLIAFDVDVHGDGIHVNLNLYDGNTVTTIASNGFSNAVPRLNCSGSLVWTRFNFSISPWVSTIMARRDGENLELTDGTGEPQSAEINDLGDVVWLQWSGQSHEVRMWVEGNTVSLFDGFGPDINVHGDICYSPWDETADGTIPYLYKNDAMYRLPNYGYSGVKCVINDRGEMAWYGSNENVTDAALFMMRATQYPGDYNEDCSVTLLDFRAFADCVRGPSDHDLTNDERCRVFDFDGDNNVDLHDFGSLQQAFTEVSKSIADCTPRITEIFCSE